MHVGVFLVLLVIYEVTFCLPHARGGVSEKETERCASTESSPCTWGCFSGIKMANEVGWVFPMHVGVFLTPQELSRCTVSLPHARGGVSAISY